MKHQPPPPEPTLLVCRACGRRQPSPAGTPISVRDLAKAFGWHNPKGGALLCRECARWRL